MFHKAVNLEFKEGTALEVTFQSGEIKLYDMSSLFSKYPQLEALTNRNLFLNGKLTGVYGIRWNDELDIDAETIYENGTTVGKSDVPINCSIAETIAKARAEEGITQSELSRRTLINQSDLSKLERGIGNPSVETLKRIATALGRELCIQFLAKSAKEHHT